jgi:peptide chain release factor 2
METNHLIDALTAMKTRIEGLYQRLEIDAKIRHFNLLEAQTNDADFWNNPKNAQQIMQTISRMKGEIEQWTSLRAHLDDTLELARMNDDTLAEALTSEVQTLTEHVERISLQAMLSGEYDAENAILAIHAGAGGTDSQDWGEMLERMFRRWAEQNGYKVEEIEKMDGEEAGIKSVTLNIRGDYAYGYLQSEQGVHRLVRLSPFDSANRRHTSFVKVELWPDIQGDIDIEVNEKDIKVESYRAGGAGGQNVQKNDTAIRITHIPSGIVVQCQNERSQKQNRERAMQILKSRLFEIERKKQEQQLATLKGESISAEWGNQIRSYVLHPYHLVNDHRTGYKTGNTDAVLDGELLPFMEAYLHAKIAGNLNTDFEDEGDIDA